jgi:hypothetical protein
MRFADGVRAEYTEGKLKDEQECGPEHDCCQDVRGVELASLKRLLQRPTLDPAVEPDLLENAVDDFGEDLRHEVADDEDDEEPEEFRRENDDACPRVAQPALRAFRPLPPV